jgi:hypothetical protein
MSPCLPPACHSAPPGATWPIAGSQPLRFPFSRFRSRALARSGMAHQRPRQRISATQDQHRQDKHSPLASSRSRPPLIAQLNRMCAGDSPETRAAGDQRYIYPCKSAPSVVQTTAALTSGRPKFICVTEVPQLQLRKFAESPFLQVLARHFCNGPPSFVPIFASACMTVFLCSCCLI